MNLQQYGNIKHSTYLILYTLYSHNLECFTTLLTAIHNLDLINYLWLWLKVFLIHLKFSELYIDDRFYSSKMWRLYYTTATAVYHFTLLTANYPLSVLLEMNFFLSRRGTGLSLVKSRGLRDVVRKCKRFVEHNRLSEGSLTRFHNPWSQWRKNGYSSIYYRSMTLQRKTIAECIIPTPFYAWNIHEKPSGFADCTS